LFDELKYARLELDDLIFEFLLKLSLLFD